MHLSASTATLDTPVPVTLGNYALPTRAAAQPFPAPGLAAGNGAITSAVSNNGTIVGIMTTEIDGQLAAAWFQLYADPSSSTLPELQQSNTIEDPSADLIMPAIAFDPYNGIGVVLRADVDDQSHPRSMSPAKAYGDFSGRHATLAARPGRHRRVLVCFLTAGVTSFGRYSSIAYTATGFWSSCSVCGASHDRLHVRALRGSTSACRARTCATTSAGFDDDGGTGW